MWQWLFLEKTATKICPLSLVIKKEFMPIYLFGLQKEEETNTKAELAAQGNCTCRLCLVYMYLFVAHFPIKWKEHPMLR